MLFIMRCLYDTGVRNMINAARYFVKTKKYMFRIVKSIVINRRVACHWETRCLPGRVSQDNENIGASMQTVFDRVLVCVRCSEAVNPLCLATNK